MNKMKRGHNKDFLIGGIQSIFKKNWDITVDSQEIDLSLSYSENFYILMDKLLLGNYSSEDLEHL